MKLKFFIFSIFLGFSAYGQSVKSVPKDTVVFFIETFQTFNIEYFAIDTAMIEELAVIKSEKYKNIYGNPKGGIVKINLNDNYFKNLTLKEVFEKGFYTAEKTKFLIEDNLVSEDIFLKSKLKKFGKIIFVKHENEVVEIRLTKTSDKYF
ncbi:MAG: hypothetical protein JEY96_19595 [Bacteroidales bacterium]|nr:hypothetical protein [Bacteroidales bacterium]